MTNHPIGLVCKHCRKFTPANPTDVEAWQALQAGLLHNVKLVRQCWECTGEDLMASVSRELALKP